MSVATLTNGHLTDGEANGTIRRAYNGSERFFSGGYEFAPIPDYLQRAFRAANEMACNMIEVDAAGLASALGVSQGTAANYISLLRRIGCLPEPVQDGSIPTRHVGGKPEEASNDDEQSVADELEAAHYVIQILTGFSPEQRRRICRIATCYLPGA